MATGTSQIPPLFKSIGAANSGTSGLSYTVPGTGNNFLLFTVNNNGDSVTLWFVRPNTSVAIQLAGGNQITVTVSSGRVVKVVSATRNVNVYLAEIG